MSREKGQVRTMVDTQFVAKEREHGVEALP